MTSGEPGGSGAPLDGDRADDAPVAFPAARGSTPAGYRVDPDELTAFAGRLDQASDEARSAAAALAEPVGDLGPEGVTEAVEHLVAEWAGVLREVELDALADALRATGESYRRADELRHD